jgi:anti-sigma B factor antagonist
MSEGQPAGNGEQSAIAFSVWTEQVGDAAITRIVGELDGASSPAAERQLDGALDTEPSALVIDLCGVTIISSSGMSALLSCYKHAADRGVRVCVALPPGRILQRMELAGVTQLLHIRPTVDEALVTCGSSTP